MNSRDGIGNHLMSDPTDVQIDLSLAGIRIAYSGRREFFDRTISPLLAPLSGGGEPFVLNGTAPPPAVSAPQESYTPPADHWGVFQRQIDPVKLAASKDLPSSLVAAFAFFLWNYEKQDEFGEEELAGCFRAEGLTPPEHGSDVFDDLERRRILTHGRADGSWKLTPRGVAHVRSRLLSA
jgi:uncharacterized protein YjhX (UPF0386 family)